MKFKLVYLFLLITIFSCQKDQNLFIPDQTYPVNSDLLLSKLVKEPISYLVTLKEGKTIIKGQDNITIEIPFQTLTDSLGTVISGEIKVEVKEFTKQKSDLISSPNNFYNEHLLDSKKLVFLKFSQRGKTLFISNKIYLYLEYELEADNFQFYKGESKDKEITWYAEIGSNLSVKNGIWNINDEESSFKVTGYKIEISGSSKWYNIAKKISPKAVYNNQINIISSSHINSKNSLVYFIADNENTIFRLYRNPENTSFLARFSISEEPVSGKIIMISQFGDNNFQFGMTNAVLGLDTELRLVSEELSLQEIKAKLKSL